MVVVVVIIVKGQEETLGGDRYVYGLDGGGSFTGISLSPNSSNGIR